MTLYRSSSTSTRAPLRANTKYWPGPAEQCEETLVYTFLVLFFYPFFFFFWQTFLALIYLYTARALTHTRARAQARARAVSVHGYDTYTAPPDCGVVVVPGRPAGAAT